MYKGTRPEISVADPELVKEIMIKKFDKFPNHTNFEMEDKVFLTYFFFKFFIILKYVLALGVVGCQR